MGNAKAEFEHAYSDFRGGLNTKLLGTMLFDNQVVTANDVLVHRGGIRKASGHSAIWSSPPVASRGLSLFRVYDLPNAANNAQTLYQLTNGRLYRVSAATSAVVGSGFGATAKLSYATANRKTYITNGTLYRGYSNGIGVVYSPTAPAERPRFVLYHQEANRLFGGRGTSTLNRVWFSDINAFETWPTNNFFDIPESRVGDTVMGLARLFGRLVIFGEKTISVLYGRVPTDFQMRTLEWSRGCQFPFTIVEFDGFILYLRSDGIYRFDGSGPSTKISDPIESIIGDITITNENGPVAMRSSENFYVLSYKSKTNNTANNVLQNDYELTALPPTPEAPYWHFQGPNTRGFASYSRWIGGTDKDETYYMESDGNGGISISSSQYLYKKAGIAWTCDTKQLDLGAPFVRKEFLEIEVHVEAESHDNFVLVQYKVDNETSWRTLEAIDLGKMGNAYGHHVVAEAPRNRVIFPIVIPNENAAIGNYIQIRFSYKEPTAKATQPTGRLVHIIGFAVRARRWNPKG